jgi:hypothetical protein
MICEKCGEEFLEDWRKCPKGNPRFCSRSCSNSKIQTKEMNDARRIKLKKHPDCFCKTCGKKISHRNNQKLCKECRIVYKKYDNRYYYVRDYRKRVKEKAVEYKGGKCILCGYNKCNRSLAFHHIDATEKDFSISRKIIAWDVLKKELDKCDLVCNNCHGEIHENIDRWSNW